LGSGIVAEEATLIGTPPAQPSLGGRGNRSLAFSKPEFDSVSQVGVFLQNNPVSPLSLRERVRVRVRGSSKA
jgi:hypothetical protein